MTLNGDIILHENVMAMGRGRNRRPSSITSFMSHFDESLESEDDSAPLDDYPVGRYGVHQMRPRFNSERHDFEVAKDFRKKVERLAKDERRRSHTPGIESDDDVEVARGGPTTSNRLRRSQGLDCLVSDSLPKPRTKLREETERPLQSSNLMMVTSNNNPEREHLKTMRMKLFATRTAMNMQPDLVEHTRKALESKKITNALTSISPGAFSLNAAMTLATSSDVVPTVNNMKDTRVTKEAMNDLITSSFNNIEITQELVFSKKFDDKWKSRYTEHFMRRDDAGNRPKRPINDQGWVFPLQHICTKFGINSDFFTKHKMDLTTARNKVLATLFSARETPSEWLTTIHPSAVANTGLNDYLVQSMDTAGLQARLHHYRRVAISDVDRTRVAGQFYNNLRIGKRMFGAARKQKYISSIIGGMERRFEILENSVNHIPFTHVVSDANKHLCRNPRIHCKDSTRVVLNFPANRKNDFIHANRVSGDVLFNEFIITQAPMKETIDDFWHMVWQEQSVYILMLTSRKEESRCASYWPRSPSDPPVMVSGGISVENFGVFASSDPLFRVTHLRLIGPDREERHVEHWQGDMNNSSNLMTPIKLLRLVRNSSRPVVVHDCLGVSRAATLVASEIAICSIIKGPTYKYPIQRAVQYLRKYRPFSIETPMQYVFVHRVINHFFKDLLGNMKELDGDYQRWLADRSTRMFFDDLTCPIPGYRLLSPKVDPDLLRLVNRPERPNYRREAPDCIGEMPGTLTINDTILTPARQFVFE